MTTPLRVMWVGPADESPLGRLNRACQQALGERPDVVLTQDRPDLAVVTDGSLAYSPGALVVQYPLGSETDVPPGTCWAASFWHRARLRPGAPLLPPGNPLPGAAGEAWTWSQWADALVAQARHELSPAVVRLSVCVMGGQGAEALARCLASIAPVADEVLVCGVPSEAAVAGAYRAHLLPALPGQDRADGRNRLMAAARGCWVLMLDGDEVLARGAEELQRVKDVLPRGTDLALVRVATPAILRQGEAGGALWPRFHARHPALAWAGDGESLIDRDAPAAPLPVKLVTGILVVRPAARGVTADRSVAMLRQGLRQDPRNAQLHFQCAVVLLERGDSRGAARHLRCCLDRLRRIGMNAEYEVLAIRQLMALELDLGHWQESERLAASYETVAGDDGGYWVVRGTALAYLGQWAQARAAWGRGLAGAGAAESGPLRQHLAAMQAEADRCLAGGTATLLRPIQPSQRLAVCLVLAPGTAAPAPGLASLTAVADELIVVTGDPGASAAAGAYGARIVADTAAGWQQALQAASADWVLLLDAGEGLEAGAQPALQDLLQQPVPAAVSLDVDCLGAAGWRRERRLWRREAALADLAGPSQGHGGAVGWLAGVRIVPIGD